MADAAVAPDGPASALHGPVAWALGPVALPQPASCCALCKWPSMCRLCALAWLAAKWLLPPLLTLSLLSKHAAPTPPPLELLPCPQIAPRSFALPCVKPVRSIRFISCRAQSVRNDIEACPWSGTIRWTYLELWLLRAGLEPCRWGLGRPLLKMPSNMDCMPPGAVLGEPRHRGSICSKPGLVWRSQGRVRLTSDRELLGTSFAGEASRYDPSVMLAPSASR